MRHRPFIIRSYWKKRSLSYLVYLLNQIRFHTVVIGKIFDSLLYIFFKFVAVAKKGLIAFLTDIHMRKIQNKVKCVRT